MVLLPRCLCCSALFALPPDLFEYRLALNGEVDQGDYDCLDSIDGLAGYGFGTGYKPPFVSSCDFSTTPLDGNSSASGPEVDFRVGSIVRSFNYEYGNSPFASHAWSIEGVYWNWGYWETPDFGDYEDSYLNIRIFYRTKSPYKTCPQCGFFSSDTPERETVLYVFSSYRDSSPESQARNTRRLLNNRVIYTLDCASYPVAEIPDDYYAHAPASFLSVPGCVHDPLAQHAGACAYPVMSPVLLPGDIDFTITGANLVLTINGIDTVLDWDTIVDGPAAMPTMTAKLYRKYRCCRTAVGTQSLNCNPLP